MPMPGSASRRLPPLACLLVLLLAAGAAGTAPAPATAEEPLRGCVAKTAADFPSREALAKAAAAYGYDVKECRLRLTLSPDDSVFDGEVEILFSPTTLAGDTLVLDCADLAVTGITHADTALGFRQRGDSLLVALVGRKRIGALDSLTVAYRGVMRPGTAGLALNRWVLAEDDTVLVAATMSEPSDARRWWPCKDTPGDKFTCRVDLTVPTGLTAVSNGLLTGVEDHGDGWSTWHWVESHPIATYLVSAAVSDYTVLQEACVTPASGVIPLRNWVLAPDVEDAAADFAPLCDMMAFLEELAGPYPYADEKYGHVEFLNMRSGAMEHTTVTSYGNLLLTGTNVYDRIVVHELAHQWFGDSLTPAGWEDIWLNEGFATYTEALWREHLYGMDGDDVHGGYWWKMDRLRWGDDFIGHTPVYDPFPILDRIVYDKGAWILHMLRGRVGDDVFFALLHDWATGQGRYEDNVTTEEFVQLASDHAGEDLHPFFTPWLTTSDVPRLEITRLVGDGPAGPGTRLALRLVDRSGIDFDNVFPVRISTTAGTEWTTLRLVGREATLRYDASARIDSVAVDPLHWVLWREVTAPPVSLRITGLAPNPVTRLPVDIVFRLEEDAPLRLRIFDVRGRRLLDRDLGVRPGLLDDQVVTWDGRDGEGRRLPSGVYWAQLLSDRQESVAKIVVVR